MSVILVNYNSHDFIRLSLKALHFLTASPARILICDNGSSYGDFIRLRHACSFYPNVTLIARTQSTAGSMGHGEALNVLMGMVDTPYTAVLDADCIPLAIHWDRILMDRLDGAVKIAGTPVAHNSPNNKKPTDFPLMFLCLAETRILKELGIDFRPKNIAAGQDTGWELREKILAAGYRGFCLRGENTRTYRQGPLADCICDEYYLDGREGSLFCSHLGRGSNPVSGKYGKSRRKGIRAHREDKEKWLGLVEAILDGRIRELALDPAGPIESIPCDLCGHDDAEPQLETMDPTRSVPGSWKAVKCRKCGLVYTNPRPRPGKAAMFPAGEAAPQPSGWQRRLRLAGDPRDDLQPLPRASGPAGKPRALEIGMESHVRLERLRAAGWDVACVEPSPAAAETARTLGIQVHGGTFETSEFPAGGFDCIILDRFLDRLPSPAASLRRIGGWLKPGGELLLSAPDWNGSGGPGARVPARLFHFTPGTLRRYLSGFDVSVTHRASSLAAGGGSGGALKADTGAGRLAWLRLSEAVGAFRSFLSARAGRTGLMLVRARKK